MKKNALIIAYNSLNNSGVPNVIYNTILALNNDFYFDIITFRQDNDFYINKLNKKNIRVSIHCLEKTKSNNKICKIFWNLFGKYKYWKKEISKIFSQKNYDVIHSFKEFDGYIFLKSAKKANVKTRLNHTNVIHSKNKSLILNFFDNIHKKKANKYATTNIAVSKNAGDISFGQKPYEIIHNTYDEENYYFHPKKHNNLKIIQVGTYSDNKNQLFSLQIIKHLIKFSNNATLTFFGHENETGYMEKIKNAVNNLNLKNNVTLIDGQSSTKIPYFEYDISLIPSKFEGASIVAIESQANGLEVVASKSLPQEINAGGITFLDLSDGPEKWAKTISNLYQQKNKKNQINLKDFSFQTFQEKIKRLYL